jgi:hypothetical protein
MIPGRHWACPNGGVAPVTELVARLGRFVLGECFDRDMGRSRRKLFVIGGRIQEQTEDTWAVGRKHVRRNVLPSNRWQRGVSR